VRQLGTIVDEVKAARELVLPKVLATGRLRFERLSSE